MNIYFIFSGGRRKRWINKKYSPSEFFYGFKELSSINEKISFLEERDIGMMPKKSILSIFFRKLSFFSYNIPLEMIYGFLKTIKSLPFSDKDIIVSTTNGIGLTLAFAKKLGILKSNLIFIAMGLIPKNSIFIKILIYKYILSKANIIVISLEEKKFLSKIMPNKNIQYIPFGVDNKFWKPKIIKTKEEYIFAIGNDKSRDWDTLIDSWDDSLPNLKIVTSKLLKNNKSNIQIIRGNWRENLLTDEEILSLYNGSKFVIIPLYNTIQPSGQSVCLQAMSCEKPVIMSYISGLWDHSKLIHKENIYLVKPENPSLLNRSIKELISDNILCEKIAKNGRELVNEKYNVEKMSIYLKDYLDHLSQN